jgi:glutathione S-transferase
MSQSLARAADRPILHHIPVCPFSQRLEILLELKGRRDAVDFEVVDITQPRSERILRLTGGSTALPVMEFPGGRALKESLVLMDYLEEWAGGPPIRRPDAYERAVENLMVTLADAVVGSGYRLILNQDLSKTAELSQSYLDAMAQLDAFLLAHATSDGPWLFDRFGWAEAVFTPFFQRFVFIPYYEGFDLPEDERFARARRWRQARVTHPAAQQASEEEIVKVYYDYAIGAGNGAVPQGRKVSSFAFEPNWRQRPMPPREKYETRATDEELGLNE